MTFPRHQCINFSCLTTYVMPFKVGLKKFEELFAPIDAHVWISLCTLRHHALPPPLLFLPSTCISPLHLAPVRIVTDCCSLSSAFFSRWALDQWKSTLLFIYFYSLFIFSSLSLWAHLCLVLYICVNFIVCLL